MTDRTRGLYEVLITEAIASQLRELRDADHALEDGVRPAKVFNRLALHIRAHHPMSDRRADEKDRVAVRIALTRKLIEQIGQTPAGSGVGPDAPLELEQSSRRLVGVGWSEIS